MPKILRLQRGAEEEAAQARQWYAGQSSSAAESFLQELNLAFDRIARAPARYPFFQKPFRMYLLRKFPFIVIYREKSDVIEVLAVAHA